VRMAASKDQIAGASAEGAMHRYRSLLAHYEDGGIWQGAARQLIAMLLSGAGAIIFRTSPTPSAMTTYTAVIERDSETGLYVAHIPGWPGAHTQGATLDELRNNLREVVELLRADGEPELEAEFVGTQTVAVP
jgi:predicted RNase H-like HicB family nuclease